jgi:hypothetical protein
VKEIGEGRTTTLSSRRDRIMVNWITAQRKAARTARWAVTMTKVRIRKAIARTRWQLVTFCGAAGGESVGIVDLLAIRKNHRPTDERAKRGDLFEMVLIQIKGGTASYPSFEEVLRLRRISSLYRAKAVLLARWKKGRQVDFSALKRNSKTMTAPSECWQPLETIDDVFR